MLIPSIDLKDGAVVQLVQGERLAIRDEDIFRWVSRFENFPKVQLIDLNGAFGSGENLQLVRQIAARMSCRVGGGIRSVERAIDLLEAGAKQVIIGSALFRGGRPDLELAESFAEIVGREKIIGAVDSRENRVVVNGWKTATEITPVEAVQMLEPWCGEFLYTHVETEGLMRGTDLDAILRVARATKCRVTAAGGITTQAEIDFLDRAGVDAVVGMAIYTGLLKV
jgi:phosphoribosylformimino-5-aminoimidazole carboxamide ribotide isomerase